MALTFVTRCRPSAVRSNNVKGRLDSLKLGSKRLIAESIALPFRRRTKLMP